MAEVSKERPKYPVEFIINYLRANNPENDDKGGNKNNSSVKSKNKSPLWFTDQTFTILKAGSDFSVFVFF